MATFNTQIEDQYIDELCELADMLEETLSLEETIATEELYHTQLMTGTLKTYFYDKIKNAAIKLSEATAEARGYKQIWQKAQESQDETN